MWITITAITTTIIYVVVSFSGFLLSIDQEGYMCLESLASKVCLLLCR